MTFNERNFFWEKFKEEAKKQNLDIACGKLNNPGRKKKEYRGMWLELNNHKNTPWFAFIVRDSTKAIACSLTVDPKTCQKLKKDKIEIEKVFGHELIWKDDKEKNPKMCRIEDSSPMDYHDCDLRTKNFQWYIDTANKYIDVFKPRLLTTWMCDN